MTYQSDSPLPDFVFRVLWWFIAWLAVIDWLIVILSLTFWCPSMSEKAIRGLNAKPAKEL
jgi:hypothetical protein